MIKQKNIYISPCQINSRISDKEPLSALIPLGPYHFCMFFSSIGIMILSKMHVLPIEGEQNIIVNPFSRFMYAIESLETKKRYPQRFKTFLDYLKIPGFEIEERLINFYDLAKSNPTWLQDSLINFITFQKERVQKDKIAASTISNYYKPVKLFCDMNDILLNCKWQKNQFVI